MLNYLADQKAHNESMYLSAAENKDKYSEARYARKMDAYRDIFDMIIETWVIPYLSCRVEAYNLF